VVTDVFELSWSSDLIAFKIAGLGFLQNSTQHINIGISVGQSEDLSMEQIIWDGGENHFDGELAQSQM
jgi:hypothetical protein